MNTVNIYSLNSGSITWSHEGQRSLHAWTRTCKAVKSGNVYILGASTSSLNRGRNRYGTARYHVADDRWEHLPTTTPWGPYNGPVMFAHQDTLYATNSNQTWTLDLHQGHTYHELPNGWTQLNIKLPFRLISCPNCLTSVGDRVFIVGTVGNRLESHVISWRPGTGEREWGAVSGLNVRRDPSRLCAVSDGQDQIWVISGCFFCETTGFVERYQVSTDSWTTLSAFPDLTFSPIGIYAQICGFHDGYIYAIFSHTWRSGLDRRFHIFNTRNNSWSVSQTQLRTEPFQSASAVVQA